MSTAGVPSRLKRSCHTWASHWAIFQCSKSCVRVVRGKSSEDARQRSGGDFTWLDINKMVKPRKERGPKKTLTADNFSKLDNTANRTLYTKACLDSIFAKFSYKPPTRKVFSLGNTTNHKRTWDVQQPLLPYQVELHPCINFLCNHCRTPIQSTCHGLLDMCVYNGAAFRPYVLLCENCDFDK